MNKTLLIIGGGIETLPGVLKAKELGLDVIVSDQNPKAPCFEYADYSFYESTYDIKSTLKKAINFNNSIKSIDGVISIGTDIPKTVSAVSNALKIPGISEKSAKISADKLLMKKVFSDFNIPIPWFSEILSFEHFLELVKTQNFPLVIKPIDSRGSRGVLLISNESDLKWSYEHAINNSPARKIMLERFLDGPQISTESIIFEAKSYTSGFSDRNYLSTQKYLPHFVEDGGQLPSILSNKDQEKVNNLIQEIADILHLKDGTLKGDIVISEGEPFIIEIAARLSGGYFCSHEIPLNTGVDFLENAIKIAIGDPLNKDDLIPKFVNPIAQRYLFPKPGRVRDIKIPEWIKSSPVLEFIDIRVKKGDIISKIENHPSRSGLVITSGLTKQDAVNNAEKIISAIQIITN